MPEKSIGNVTPRIDTIVDLFRHVVARDKSPLLHYKDQGKWRALSAHELEEKVRTVTMGLYALGVRAGDRVGLLSENRVEWTIADLGILNCGASNVPIYSTQAPKQVAYILNDAGVEVLFISDQAQYDRVRESLVNCSRLRVIVSFDSLDKPSGKVMGFEDFLNWGRAADHTEPALYETLRSSVQPETIATLIYTSGTTGDPKGVMLSHRNLASNATTSAQVAELTEQETVLTFLPFSHVFERTTVYMYFYEGVSIYYARGIETVGQDLLEARPHFMTSVPRLFEKIYARAMEKAEKQGPLSAAIAGWAMKVAGAWGKVAATGGQPDAILKFKRYLADLLVFSKWRAAMGGRIRALVSGGAPLSPELAYIFYGAGIPIYQGYGMTESSPIISTNHPGANRIGSVGQPLPGVTVKIAEDGEILCAGPNVMVGYYNRDEETQSTLEIDGEGRIWLHTGDIGYLDQDNFLFITDRKKDLLKTSGGKYIAPQPIENAIKLSRYVSQVVVIGDQRKFPSALIVPQMDALRAYADQHGIAYGNPAELIKNPKIVGMIEREIDKLTVDLSHHEKIKGVVLLDHEMTIENGELTPTLKIKRRVVVEKNKELIDRLYADKEAVHIANQ